MLETFRLSDLLSLSSVSLNELDETVPLNLLDPLEEVHLRRVYHLFLLSFHCMLTSLSKIVLEIVTQFSVNLLFLVLILANKMSKILICTMVHYPIFSVVSP